jgi:hypothetical protein
MDGAKVGRNIGRSFILAPGATWASSGQYAYMDTEALGGVNIELIHAYR